MRGQLETLTPEQRAAVRRQISTEAIRRAVDAALDDPGALALDSLVSVYKALASGNVKALDFKAPSVREANFKRADDIRAEMHRRITNLDRILGDPEAQAAELERIKDPVHLFNDWLFMLDPRHVGVCPYQPFRLFEFQEDVLRWIGERYEKGESGLIEKSRDMGLSVLCVGFGFGLWLTEPGAVIGYGSRKVELVHKLEDADSLLHKPAIFLDYLPDFLKPAGFSNRRHFNHCNIVNPANRAQMKGEGGDEIGRGGRASLYFADEFSYMARQEAAERALSGTTNCVIYLGTSAGPTTHMSALKRLRVYPVLSLPWYLDPRKLDTPEDVGNPLATSKWEQSKRKSFKANPFLFAREFECDDSKANSQLTIPIEWIAAAINLQIPGGGDAAEIVAGLDLAVSENRDESVLIIRRDSTVAARDLHTWVGKSINESADHALPICHAQGVAQLNYDRGGIGATFAGAAARQIGNIYLEGVDPTARPTPSRYMDDPKTPGHKRFANRVTELWWALRVRFQCTYERLHEGIDHPWSDCISIPNDEVLIRQLGSRPYSIDNKNKIRLVPKDKLPESPDRADALAHTEVRFRGRPKAKRKKRRS